MSKIIECDLVGIGGYIYKNLNSEEYDNICKRLGVGMRGLIDGEDIYCWQGENTIHKDIIEWLVSNCELSNNSCDVKDYTTFYDIIYIEDLAQEEECLYIDFSIDRHINKRLINYMDKRGKKFYGSRDERIRSIKGANHFVKDIDAKINQIKELEDE